MKSPLVTVEEAAYRRTGCAFGVREATLAVGVAIAECGDRELAQLETGLASLLDEPLPGREKGDGRAARVAQLFAFACGAIQRQSRIAVTATYKVMATSRDAKKGFRCTLALPAPNTQASRIVARMLASLFNVLCAGTASPSAIETMREKSNETLRGFATPGVNTYLIAMTADRLGIPVQTLYGGTLVLGTGARSRLMDSTLTDATPAIGAKTARSKADTAHVLRAAGLPGAVHMAVTSADHAVEAAGKLGYPVVVKPADRDRGEGVAADLRNAEAVRRAYEAAREVSSNILVERFAPGSTHRLMVFNGRVLRVMRRVAGGVTGDGVHTVAQLVALEMESEYQLRARRRHGAAKLALDEEALDLLAQEGLTVDHVPPEGQYVRLRRRDNINAGGRNDVVPLDEVHPDNLRLAVDAAALLRLDIAGIDLIMDDVRRSWLQAPALICEINAQPQFGARAHLRDQRAAAVRRARHAAVGRDAHRARARRGARPGAARDPACGR